jgi:hypothetical protein
MVVKKMLLLKNASLRAEEPIEAASPVSPPD